MNAGDALRGSLWLSGTGPGLVVRLQDGGKVLVAAAGASVNIGSFDITKSPVGSIAIELRAD